MALLKLENSAEWKAIGGRLLIPVHDEIIAEVPIQYAKEGGELLSKLMCEAAEFLPFPSKCDVTTTLRWYGVEYPCKYERPEDLDNLSEDNIRWIQWHLYDLEYQLPVYKNEDGSKPIGDAALGINGVMSFELESHIRDYKNRYKLQTDTEFIQHIDNLVVLGSNDTYEEG